MLGSVPLLGRQSMNEDGVQNVVVVDHVVFKDQACCSHLRGKILDPTHLLKRVAPRRYLKPIKAPREVRFGPSRLRVVPRKESVPRFPRRNTPVQYAFVALVFEGRQQEIPCQRVPLYCFEAEPPWTCAAFSVSTSPTRIYCGEIDTKANKKPTPFA